MVNIYCKSQRNTITCRTSPSALKSCRHALAGHLPAQAAAAQPQLWSLVICFPESSSFSFSKRFFVHRPLHPPPPPHLPACQSLLHSSVKLPKSTNRCPSTNWIHLCFSLALTRLAGSKSVWPLHLLFCQTQEEEKTEHEELMWIVWLIPVITNPRIVIFIFTHNTGFC